MPEPTLLETAISSAVEAMPPENNEPVENIESQLNKEAEEKGGDPVEEVEEKDSPVEEEVVEEEEPEEEVVEEDSDTKQALELFKLLKNPNTANKTLQQLVNQFGLELADKAVKTEVKNQTVDIIKKHLKEYDFLAEGLAPAIEELLSQRESVAKQEAAVNATKVEVSNAYDKLAAVTKGDVKKYESRIVQLMEEVLPGPNVKPYKHLDNLYKMAKAEKQEADTKVQKVQKVIDNSNDVGSRISQNGIKGAGELKTGPVPGQKFSLDEAISLANTTLEKRK